jgi:sugar phosphate permease
LQYAFVLALLQCFATQAPDYQWQPYYVSIGLDNIGLGYLLAGCFAAGFAGSFIVERLKIDGRNPKTFPAIQLLLGGAIITAVGISNLIIAVPALLLQELVRGMFIPIQHSYVQSNIPSNNRHQAAMVSSLDSMSANFGALVGLFASGWIAKTFSIPTAWKFTGAIVIIGTIAAYFFKKQGG